MLKFIPPDRRVSKTAHTGLLTVNGLPAKGLSPIGEARHLEAPLQRLDSLFASATCSGQSC